MTLTKFDLVELVSDKSELEKKQASDLVEFILDKMKSELASGMDVKISGFGTFKVRDKRSRMGRNPQTGEEMEISARRVVTFKPSEVLRDVLNKNKR